MLRWPLLEHDSLATSMQFDHASLATSMQSDHALLATSMQFDHASLATLWLAKNLMHLRADSYSSL